MTFLPWCPGGACQKPLPGDCNQLLVAIPVPGPRWKLATLKIQDGVLQPSEIHGECPWEKVSWYIPIRPTMSKTGIKNN